MYQLVCFYRLNSIHYQFNNLSYFTINIQQWNPNKHNDNSYSDVPYKLYSLCGALAGKKSFPKITSTKKNLTLNFAVKISHNDSNVFITSSESHQNLPT